MLYKYTNQYYGHGLANMGLFRIGTLEDYRKSEHARGIKDLHEGTKKISVDITHRHYKSGSDIPKSLDQLGIIKVSSSSSNITLEDIHISTTIHSKNLFIWCGSYECSKDVMNNFDGADTCVEIFDVNSFVTVLSQIMNFDAKFLGLYKVSYQDRNEKWDEREDSIGLNPALIKSIAQSGQKEVRAIWEPLHNIPIHPHHGRCDGLSNYCRVVNI